MAKFTLLEKDIFMARMEELWLSHGNKNTLSIHKAWETIYECYNAQLSGKSGLHVSDSVCGTGKTLSVVAACASIAQKQSSVGGLVVVRFIEEAQEIAKRINDIVGESVAIAFHSGLTKEQKKNLDLSQYQFIIITHVSYIASVSGDYRNKGRFRNWTWGEREFRIVDESLDLVERHSITRKDIKEFFDIVTDYKDKFSLKRTHRDVLDLVEAIEEFLHNADRDGYVGKLYEPVLSHFSNVRVSSMLDDILEAGNGDWISGNSDYNISKFTDLAILFDRVIRLEVWISEGQNGDMKASAGQLLLPDDFESLCILDATSNVDKIYELFQGTNADSIQDFTRYSVSRNVRNFSNCNLHVLPTGDGLGKLTGKQSAAVRHPRLVQWAKDNFSKGDKVLFAGHKDQMASLQNLLKQADVGFEFDVIWWGAIDGKNTWAGFNKLVVTSLLFLPPDHSPTAKLAFKVRMPWLEIDGDDNIASSAMAVSLIQLLCRIQIRKVADEYGNCAKSDIYLPLEASSGSSAADYKTLLTKRGRYLLDSIEESLNKISVCEWEDFSFSKKKPQSDKKKASTNLNDAFISWINLMQPGDVFELSDFGKEFSVSQRQTISKYLNRSTSIIAKHINERGIVKESVRRKGTKFYYAS